MADLVTKAPPAAIEAEAALLGSLMLDRGVAPLVAGIVTADDFFHPRHSLLYAAVSRLAQAGQPLDPITVAVELGDRLPEAGGQSYLIDLVGNYAVPHHAEDYAAIVREKAGLRRLLDAADRVMRAAYAPGVTLDDALGTATRELAAVEAAAPAVEDDMAVALDKYEALIEARGRGEDRTRHLSSAWYDLDQRMTLAGGDLALVAGRPGMGKTAWALNYAWAVAQYAWVDFWSLEMTRDRLFDRLAVMLAGVDARRLREGRLNDEEQYRHAEAVSLLRGSKLRIHEPHGLTAAAIRRHALKAASRGRGPALVVVDYLQLMDHPRAARPDLEIGATSRALKKFANEAGIVVMALSQLSRPEKTLVGKRPSLTDLRGSGDLEQDADVVIFPHRPGYYEGQGDEPGLCEVVVGKFRNGSPCVVPLEFQPRRQRFVVPGVEYLLQGGAA